ncbi:cbb3-type cytochrome c oxidase subunit I [Sulfurifustis variabilis]|uniref:cbb3-type cytochrome c oxidase subunit I n=1 Tax=Sulfurifustis variabilis TaxID=1675686 RepID=UPI000BBAFBFE|nr:cbb3-type cytochrome c oxidase subunit I [Sulfurifustis variabilis]
MNATPARITARSFPTASEREAATYALPVPTDARRALTVGWLWLAVLSLLGSGLFSILLVLSRTPYVQNVFPWTDFFHTALVVHVDLSVLVWFLAFGGVLWSLNSTAGGLVVGRVALYTAFAGAWIVAISPFTGPGHALMSNYVPVLQNTAFFTGLLVFGGGVLLLVLRGMTAIPPVGVALDGAAALRFGLNTAAVATAMAALAFAWTWATMPSFLEGQAYYELLFWGGGHVLQFSYTLLMLVAWLWLGSASGAPALVTPRLALFFFALGLVTVFVTPLFYYGHAVTSAEHIKLFTWQMRYGGGLATAPLGLAVLIGLLRAPRVDASARPLRAALAASVLLFGVGGVIGFLISGSNVTIPAHYHGAIVGITLAFMGLAYHLIPRLGGRPVDAKWATVQPWLYGIGQLLHVIGLVWSGGYGVQRKVAAAEQGLDALGKIAGMGLMGLGGLIAIAGGVLFLVLVLKSLPRRPDR